MEIVGDADVSPRKPIEILQENGALASTPPERVAEIEALLKALF